MTLTREDIYRRVSATLVETLNVEEEEIKPESTLQGDLGAESIDFLDIVFRLERGFGIRIPRDELFPEAIFEGDPEFVRDGRVTDKGMGELHARMPYADLCSFDGDRRLGAVPDLFTVDLLIRYVAWKLSQDAAAGSNGSGAVCGTHPRSTGSEAQRSP
jgi:acyl carrier protein